MAMIFICGERTRRRVLVSAPRRNKIPAHKISNTKFAIARARSVRAGLAFAREARALPEQRDRVSSRHHQRAQLESATAIGFVPPKFVRRGQHFRYFQLTGLTQPAMKNFERKITLEIDENGFGIFVAAFRATASQRLFSRANVNKAGPIFGGAQSFDGENQFTRKAGEIATAHFLTGDRPAAALDNDAPATESRCMRRQPELERMKPKRNDPIAGKRSEILAIGTKRDVAVLLDKNFGLRW